MHSSTNWKPEEKEYFIEISKKRSQDVQQKLSYFKIELNINAIIRQGNERKKNERATQQEFFLDIVDKIGMFIAHWSNYLLPL